MPWIICADLFTKSVRLASSCFLSLLIIFSVDAEVVWIDDFNAPDLSSHWQHEKFKKQTDYSIVTIGDNKVLQANSNNAASGLYLNKKVDLNKTPILNWRWRMLKGFDNPNETTKIGDDFVARIYVVVAGGWFFWKTQALSYVWSQQQMPGTYWFSPYSKQAVLWSVERGANTVGEWKTEKQNVFDDFSKAFAEEQTFIHVVAIMSDTDNTGKTAVVQIDDIYFSSE
ncbi:MAG: DUF3047 domain-containing protein [Gammaproteobacteria bacterium]|nr:DUF3047 domain-containing protein [Gammaproteobacteria bacterium]